MKVFLIVLMLTAVGRCRPQRGGGEGNAVIIQETNDNGFSPYSFSYETSNGISRQERGRQEGEGELQGNAAEGSYSWTSPEGYSYTVTWTAGSGGRAFHAKLPRLLPGPATPKGGPSLFPWARR